MDEETKTVLADVQKMLAQSQKDRERKARDKDLSLKGEPDKPSPYLHVPKEIKEVFKKSEKRKEKKKHRTVIDQSGNQEDFINSLGKSKVDNPDDKHVRNMLLPYYDTIMRVSETISVQESFDTSLNVNDVLKRTSGEKEPDGDITVTSTVSGRIRMGFRYFQNRYSRFCKTFKLTESDFDLVVPKSDVWIAKFIEDCYDDAFSAAMLPVGESRQRKRFGMELGSLDSFPACCGRLLTRMYSVLEVRRKVAAEVLVSVAKIIDKGDMNLLTIEALAEDYVCDYDLSVLPQVNGRRALMFTRFLSEEYDLDFLTIYLQSRETTQQFFSVRLRDLNHQMIWTDKDPLTDTNRIAVPVSSSSLANNNYSTMNSSNAFDATFMPPSPGSPRPATSMLLTNPRPEPREAWASEVPEYYAQPSSSAAAKTTTLSTEQPVKTKTVPLHLPESLAFVHDYTMPDAPLVGFQSNWLSLLVNQLFPTLQASTKLYLLQRIMENIIESIKELSILLEVLVNKATKIYSNPQLVLSTLTLNQSNIAAKKIGICQLNGMYVIPISLFLGVMCDEWKKVPIEARDGFGNEGRSSESLKLLNTIYDDNCDKMTSLKKSISTLKAENTNTISALLKAQKKCRRLERKWDDDIATSDELISLQQVRVEIVDIKAEITAQESQLKFLERKEVVLREDIEQLWGKATMVSASLEEKASSSTGVEASSSEKHKTAVIVKKEKPGKGQGSNSGWRTDVVYLVLSALSYNEDSKESAEHARRLDEEEELKRGEMDETAKQALLRELSETKEGMLDDGLTDVDRIELGLIELSKVGQQAMRDLGLTVSPPPKFIVDLEAERTEHARLQAEQTCELLETFDMIAEDEASAMVNPDWAVDYARWKAEKAEKARLKQIEEELAELKRRQEEEDVRRQKEIEDEKLREDEQRKIFMENMRRAEMSQKYLAEKSVVEVQLKEFASKEINRHVANSIRDGTMNTMSRRVNERLASSTSKLIISSLQQITERSAATIEALMEMNQNKASAIAYGRFILELETESVQASPRLNMAPEEELAFRLNALELRLRTWEARITVITALAMGEVEEVLNADLVKVIDDTMDSLHLEGLHHLKLELGKQISTSFATRSISQVAAKFAAVETQRRVQLEASLLEKALEATLSDVAARILDIASNVAVDEATELFLATSSIDAVQARVVDDLFERALETNISRSIEEYKESMALNIVQRTVIDELFDACVEFQIITAQNDAHFRIRSARYAMTMGPVIAAGIVTAGTKRAFDHLYTRWKALDVDPFGDDTWLSEDVLGTVEEMFLVATMNKTNNRKRKAWRSIAKDVKMKKMGQKRKLTLQRQVLRRIISYNCQIRLEISSCVFIQKQMREYLARKRRREFSTRLLLMAPAIRGVFEKNLKKFRYKNYFKYLQYRAKVSKINDSYLERLSERRFLRSFYTWKYVYRLRMEDKERIRKLKEVKSFIIQRFGKSVIGKRFVKKLILMRKLVRFFKVILARKRLKRQRYALFLKMEYVQMLHTRTLFKCLKSHWLSYRHIFFKSYGISKLFRSLQNHKQRYYKSLWSRKISAVVKYRLKAALQIQSAVRMWIIKKYVLNYYRWRRFLISFQSLARMYLVLKVSRWDMYYYRAAKRIQKSFRGYKTRTSMMQLRVLGMHYAAENNNYEKLLYYITRFPELLKEMDRNGNTLMHSAAKTASRRTLKLLLKYNLDPNALSVRGFTPLHLCIMSSSVNRDDCCLYMLERGFDEDIDAPEGKTTVLIACESGRTMIAKQLLRNGMDPTVHAHNGLSCLQTACSQGLLPLVIELIEHHSDVTTPGYCGTYPLHDVVASANIEIAHVLFNNGAYVNVIEPYYKQTPLMWACQAGVAPLVKLYILQGAKIDVRDSQQRCAVHFAAFSNDVDVYNILREADADFDVVDADGNAPLHLAAEQGSEKFLLALLEGGTYPSLQNKVGDQAVHIAARNNFVSCLVHLCKYDEHIGRLNYSHQTPLGAAKFARAHDARKYIEKIFRYVDVAHRTDKGEIWWDKPVDEATDGWEVIVNPLNQRTYYNRITGQKQDHPPHVLMAVLKKTAENNELSLRRKIQVVTEGSSLNRHDYIHEYAEESKGIAALRKVIDSATCIQKYALRKLAYLARRRELRIKAMKKRILKFLKRTGPKFMKWKRSQRNRGISKFQARWRGMVYRRLWYASEWNRRWYARTKKKLVRNVWQLWKNYKLRRMRRRFEIAAKLPKNPVQWGDILIQTPKPVRTVGIYEEYQYPRTMDIFFYRNVMTGACQFDKPKDLVTMDKQAYKSRMEIQRFGASLKQIELATKLKAIWKGYRVRSYYKSIETALNIKLTAESNYIKDPSKESHIFNYALHCHTFLRDYERARRVYLEGLRQMTFKGPDIANLLYAYAVFLFVTHEGDFSDIQSYIIRAKKSEEARENIFRQNRGEGTSQAVLAGTYSHGKSFLFANTGFFRNAATSSASAEAWHNYAACRFVVYDDFGGSFDAFMEAFKYDPANEKICQNFDLMMQHYHGTDKDKLAAIVRGRLRQHAEAEEAEANLRYERKQLELSRSKSASMIAVWYKQRKARQGFNHFMNQVRSIQHRRLEGMRSNSRSQSRATTSHGRERGGGGSSTRPSTAQSGYTDNTGTSRPTTAGSNPSRSASPGPNIARFS